MIGRIDRLKENRAFGGKRMILLREIVGSNRFLPLSNKVAKGSRQSADYSGGEFIKLNSSRRPLTGDDRILALSSKRLLFLLQISDV